jgi:hypothetical protein
LLLRRVSAQVDWEQINQLRRVGLDEIALLKGHRDFVTIVSTRDETGAVILLAGREGREKETVVAFLRSIPKALLAERRTSRY